MGSVAQVHVEGFTCVSTGYRACSGVGVRAAHRARHCCAQNADHLARNSPFSAFFAEVVCTLSTLPPQTVISPSPNGGNGVIRTTICRRRTASQPLMLQNSHCHRTITSNHSDTCPHIVVGGLTLRRRRPPPYRRQQSSAQPENAAPFREHYTS